MFNLFHWSSLVGEPVSLIFLHVFKDARSISSQVCQVEGHYQGSAWRAIRSCGVP